MGEAKRRKKILGEAYGKQETSWKLEKAKRQLASEWATRMTLEKAVKRNLEEEFNFFETSSLNVGSNSLEAFQSRTSIFQGHTELEKQAMELGQMISEHPNGELFAKRFVSLSEWLPDFLKTFDLQTRKTLLLDHIKMLRENFLSERDDFRNIYHEALKAPEPFFDPSVFEGVEDSMTKAAALYFVLLEKEEFDEECRQELQEVLRICRDWVEDSDEPFDIELYDEDE